MKRRLPRFKTDAEAEEFVATADRSDYDLSSMRMTRFEFQPKRASAGIFCLSKLHFIVTGD